MNLSEIQRELDNQRSLTNAFPGMRSEMDRMNQGSNQRAAVQVQLESAGLLQDQHKKLDRVSEILLFLAQYAEKNAIASKEREVVEDRRYLENLRIAKIAMWASVVAAVLGAAGIIQVTFFR
ncbi:hypothetical protein K2P97_09485 [bacterium]|nr:hypothetical protein [bacterium]